MKLQPTRVEAPEAFSAWLDLFRWVAAMLVVISHVGGPMLQALSETPPGQRHAFHYLYSFVAGFAHSAVIIFFVMSGLFVGGGLCAEAHRRAPHAVNYFMKRIIRLSIVLIPAMALSYVLLLAGQKIYPDVYALKQINAATLGIFLCNAVYLQNVACVRFAGNDALWSLFNEWWYYVLFYPVAVAVIRRDWSLRSSLCVAICVALGLLLNLFQFSNAPLIPYMGIWLIGALLVYARPPRFLRSPLIAGLILVVFLTAARIGMGADAMHGTTLPSFAVDVVTAALFAKLIVNLKHYKGLPAPPLVSLQRALAGFSFTLYCVHIPVVYFYTAVLMALIGAGYEMIPTGIFDWVLVFGGIAATYVVGFALSLVTERHTNAVRLWLYARVSVRPA